MNNQVYAVRVAGVIPDIFPGLLWKISGNVCRKFFGREFFKFFLRTVFENYFVEFEKFWKKFCRVFSRYLTHNMPCRVSCYAFAGSVGIQKTCPTR
nr:hypothetical protein [uncultured Methanoregula sp.]